MTWPRLSYLPLLLGRLHAFFAQWLIDPDVPACQGWFSFEGVPLKWQYPVGLLFDLLSGSEPASSADASVDPNTKGSKTSQILPWDLILHFNNWPSENLIPLDADLKPLHDTFMNSVKEADYLRNGTAKVIMSLSRDDSTKLWESVKQMDLPAFQSINHKFLNPPGGEALRHVPLKVYLPSTVDGSGQSEQPNGVLRVIQAPVSLVAPSRDAQTLGAALHDLLPTVFPSRRSYIYAQAVLHGAVVPASAPVQDLMKTAAYCDGFLHVAVSMVNIDSP